MADTYLQNFAKFDDVLLGILQHCGKIEPFLDAIFYFLGRRTDFFRLMHSPNDKLGFPEGIAEGLVRKIFRKHQAVILKDDQIYQKKLSKGMKNKTNDSDNISPEQMSDTPPVDHEIEITSSGETSSMISNQTTNCPRKIENPQKQCGNNAIADEKLENTSNTSGPSNMSFSSSSSTKPANKLEDSKTERDAGTSSSTDCHNGAMMDMYSWSQTISDVDIKVPVPVYVKKSKDISVNIKANSVSVGLKADPLPDSGFSSKELVNGELTYPIRCDDSLWSLLPGECVSINLEKQQHRWWTSVIKGHKEIDKQSIDTTQHVQDFDNQTQADIRKVMYDQEQKMKGLPTSDEEKTYSMLKDAWNAEGSPFKGQPYDPSLVNISSQGGMQLPQRQ